MNGRPLLVQIVALLLAVMFAVLLLSFVVVLLAPTPTLAPMTIDGAVSKLRMDSSEPLDSALHMRLDDRPPNGPNVDLISRAAAARLDLPVSKVGAVWLRLSSQAPSIEILSADSEGREVASQVDVGAVLAERNVALPPFALSAQRPDGRWMTVAPRQPLFSGWRLHLLAGSVLGAMAVLPIAWIAARRLTRPVRALASAVASLDLHGDGPPAPLEGPAEIQAAAAAFNAMRNRIRAQANERTRMVAAIAHDLRTPLTGLRLRAESAPPGVRDRMAVDIRRMDAMITQILDFARAEASTPAAECVDVRQLVQEAVDAARENGGDVETALPDRLVTRGDAIMLRRAVDNLLNNAIRYGGRAHVALEEAPGGWSIAIQDHGPGVPEEQLDRLGDPFHRVEFSRNATTGGIGLGLSIAKTAARLHGGRLEFMNRPTGGLRVVLSARSSER